MNTINMNQYDTLLNEVNQLVSSHNSKLDKINNYISMLKSYEETLTRCEIERALQETQIMIDAYDNYMVNLKSSIKVYKNGLINLIQ
jgi:hypothetical protein